MKRFLVLPLLVSAILCVACGGPTDAEIQAQVESALRSNASTVDVSVKVTGGVVVLSGEVADEAARSRAARLARVRGVAEVRNDLTISVAPPPGEGVDDGTVKRKIEAALKEKNCGPINVSVKDGTATLSGEIEQLKVGECVMAAQVISNKVENKLKFKE